MFSESRPSDTRYGWIPGGSGFSDDGGSEGSHHGEGNRGNVYGLVEAAAPRRNTATVGESTGVDGATAMTATEGDPSPWDTVTVMLMPPDAARAMGGPLEYLTPPMALAKIEVLPQQRRFQLIFPSEGASEPSGDPARSNEPATPSPSNNSVPPCDSTGLYSRRIAPWAKFIVKAALTTVLAFIVAGDLWAVSALFGSSKLRAWDPPLVFKSRPTDASWAQRPGSKARSNDAYLWTPSKRVVVRAPSFRSHRHSKVPSSMSPTQLSSRSQSEDAVPAQYLER
ncbi:hypothetical protein FA13DRAFT_1720104 [Coprinellus micaceus]|uniref:Uncharacterized protein n=1 Tax=Coprinellus micaceus TaxID=71717 RepID=A0A4Y7SAL0_COPMI|nr:hypothetical protein FA13DRAFT_1720104 [Coprinellus micaceus]